MILKVIKIKPFDFVKLLWTQTNKLFNDVFFTLKHVQLTSVHITHYPFAGTKLNVWSVFFIVFQLLLGSCQRNKEANSFNMIFTILSNLTDPY